MHSCLLIAFLMDPICNSMIAPHWDLRVVSHSLIKSCYGGLWKTFKGLGLHGFVDNHDV